MTSGSAGIHLFLYSIFYFFTTLKITKVSPRILIWGRGPMPTLSLHQPSPSPLPPPHAQLLIRATTVLFARSGLQYCTSDGWQSFHMRLPLSVVCRCDWPWRCTQHCCCVTALYAWPMCRHNWVPCDVCLCPTYLCFHQSSLSCFLLTVTVCARFSSGRSRMARPHSGLDF